jgi:hypothetical protein
MKNIDGIWIDCTNGSIGSFVNDFGSIITESLSVLITCMDSDRDVSDMARRSSGFHGLVIDYEVIDRAVLVSAEELKSLVRAREYFTGFDEIWLFDYAPSNIELPTMSITGESCIEDWYDSTLGRWIRDTRCLLGLGDGCLLNVVSPTSDLCRSIHERYGPPA